MGVEKKFSKRKIKKYLPNKGISKFNIAFHRAQLRSLPGSSEAAVLLYSPFRDQFNYKLFSVYSGYRRILSKFSPGVDSIIESQIIEQPNFDQIEDLMQKVEIKTIAFANNILSILNE